MAGEGEGEKLLQWGRGPHLSNPGLAFCVPGMRNPALPWKLPSPAPSAILCGKFPRVRGWGRCAGGTPAVLEFRRAAPGVGARRGGGQRGQGSLSFRLEGEGRPWSSGCFSGTILVMDDLSHLKGKGQFEKLRQVGSGESLGPTATEAQAREPVWLASARLSFSMSPSVDDSGL